MQRRRAHVNAHALQALRPQLHPAAREDETDKQRQQHAHRRVEDAVHRVVDVGVHRGVEQQDAQHDAAGLHAAHPEHLAQQDQQHRADEHQRHQQQRMPALRLEDQVDPKQDDAQDAADDRAEEAVAAVLLRILQIRAHAEDHADAGEGRAAADKVVDQRTEGCRQRRLDVAHAHAGDAQRLHSMIHNRIPLFIGAFVDAQGVMPSAS